MNRVCSIFAQMLKLIPRAGFQQAVAEHKAERHSRGLLVGVSLWPCCSAIWDGRSPCARSPQQAGGK